MWVSDGAELMQICFSSAVIQAAAAKHSCSCSRSRTKHAQHEFPQNQEQKFLSLTHVQTTQFMQEAVFWMIFSGFQISAQSGFLINLSAASNTEVH